jgi:putative ABC transport system permease protein
MGLLTTLAFKNLIKTGLRTWLNAIVLSFSFVVIIYLQGLYMGMDDMASHALTEEEVGYGQYWQHQFDPYDPLTLSDSHSPIPESFLELIHNGDATAVLIGQATIYPEGRAQSILIKGINPRQELLKFPSIKLSVRSSFVPVVIGPKMAMSAGLKLGDTFTIRWRDSKGTFDAIDGEVVFINDTYVASIDNGQIWVPLGQLQRMMDMPGEATKITVKNGHTPNKTLASWTFKDHDFLLKEIKEMVAMKKGGGSIMYAILLALALIAIFDTQVLSIFKRRKEIGTLIALGMTRLRVITLFTIEGAMYGIFAAILAAAYGSPLLYLSYKYGFTIPEASQGYGFPLPATLYPSYTLNLIVGTVIIVMIAVTIVSFFPTREIAKLNPTDAIRGKIS